MTQMDLMNLAATIREMSPIDASRFLQKAQNGQAPGLRLFAYPRILWIVRDGGQLQELHAGGVAKGDICKLADLLLEIAWPHWTRRGTNGRGGRIPLSWAAGGGTCRV